MFIISHRSAIEFWRLVRMHKLPRHGMKHWLNNPARGLQLIESGLLWAKAYDSMLETLVRPDISLLDTTLLEASARTVQRAKLPSGECDRMLSESKAPCPAELDEAAEALDLLALTSAPLHVMVPTDTRRSKRDTFVCHVTSRHLPNSALYRLTRDVYVCTPEFAFMQMARELCRPKLVRLGLELCGGYGIAAHTSRGFCDCYPVTTPGSLLTAACSAKWTRGNRQAQIAAKRVVCGCASPAEADFDIQLVFPVSEGGRGIEQAELNAWVPCDLGSRTPFGARNDEFGYYCDQYYRKAHLVVECDGREGHSDDAARIRDSQKHSDLIACGERVIVVVNSQIRDVEAMNTIAMKISRLLGNRRRAYTSEEIARQQALHDDLF